MLASPRAVATSSLPYMPGMDVVRGVAITMVLLDHGLAMDLSGYVGHAAPILFAIESMLRFGHMGVHLFFILSGFLITSILLEDRQQPDYFGNFYARRALRILPAYWLMLVVLFATRSITGRYLAVCVLFLCNMPGLLGALPGYSPLWSLSVEEQFYLVWPLAVRRLSRRGLATCCGAIILLTPLLRFGLLYGPGFMRDVRFKTWAVADFFAAGALLATDAYSSRWRTNMRRAAVPLMILGMGLATFQIFAVHPRSEALINVNHALYLEPWLLAFSGFVSLAYSRPDLMALRACKPLMFLAKISYGLYLCHVFLFGLVDRYWRLEAHGSTGMVPQVVFRFLVKAAISIGVAAVSRYTFEEFFLRLKPKHKRMAQRQNTAVKIT